MSRQYWLEDKRKKEFEKQFKKKIEYFFDIYIEADGNMANFKSKVFGEKYFLRKLYYEMLGLTRKNKRFIFSSELSLRDREFVLLFSFYLLEDIKALDFYEECKLKSISSIEGQD